MMTEDGAKVLGFDARLGDAETQALPDLLEGPVADALDANGAGAVVGAPDQRGGCERAPREALVRVDVGGEEVRQLLRVGQLTGDEVAEGVVHAVPVRGRKQA